METKLEELIRQTTEERKKMTKHTVEWMLVWWFIDDLEEIVQSTVNENLTGDDLVEDILEEVDRFIPLRSAEEWDIFEWILHRHLKPKEEVEKIREWNIFSAECPLCEELIEITAKYCKHCGAKIKRK